MCEILAFLFWIVRVVKRPSRSGIQTSFVFVVSENYLSYPKIGVGLFWCVFSNALHADVRSRNKNINTVCPEKKSIYLMRRDARLERDLLFLPLSWSFPYGPTMNSWSFDHQKKRKTQNTNIYVCTYVHMCLYICTSVHIYTHKYIHMYIFIHMNVHTDIYVCIYIHMLAIKRPRTKSAPVRHWIKRLRTSAYQSDLVAKEKESVNKTLVLNWWNKWLSRRGHLCTLTRTEGYNVR